ncbi:MAG: hypothetical protein K2X50_05180 [Gammaproteobacteria bacterium]|nr:hypothetical protein [Gammaproteobacteria bacterium]
MTSTLKIALSPIRTAAVVCSADGDGPYPPNPQLYFSIKNFVESWAEWRKKSQGLLNKSSVELFTQESQQIDAFFNHIETIALKFPDYNFPGCDNEIFGFTTAIMTQIPWEWLPKTLREEKLRRLFANKDFRQRCWRDYLQLNQNSNGVSKFTSPLGINKDVANILLEHDDICAELLTLTVVRILTFVQILPQLMLQVITVATQLWFRNKLASEIALGVLNPLADTKNNNLAARDQARHAVAEIKMNESKLGEAKPHLDALTTSSQLNSDQTAAVQDHHMAYRSSLVNSLSEFNQQLTVYLSYRQTDGYFYWLGIYNKQLSEKKNTLVGALQKDLDALIKSLAKNSDIDNLQFEMSPVDPNKVINLINWIRRAEEMNNAYYKKYTGYFDGKGSLGDILRTARENLAEFLPKKSDNARQITVSNSIISR